MISVDNGVVTQVAMIGVKDSGHDITRVIVGFEKAAHYDVRTEGTDVVVFIDGAGRRKAPAAQEKANEASRAELEAQREKWEQARAELGQTKTELDRAERELEALRHKLKSARGAERATIERTIAAKNDQLSGVKSERDAALRRLDSIKAEARRGDAPCL